MSSRNLNKSRIPEEKLRVLFALLFASPEAVGLDRIREVLYPADQKRGTKAGSPKEGESQAAGSTADESASPRQHLEALAEWIEARNLPLSLKKLGSGWRLLTSDDVAEALEPVRRKIPQDRLGPAGMEVLALVAYRQPVLKADMDAIRGANSSAHLRHLLDLRFIRILGRADLPGRPFLYGTTKEFLNQFGLRDLKDLPEAGRLAFPAEAPPPGKKTGDTKGNSPKDGLQTPASTSPEQADLEPAEAVESKDHREAAPSPGPSPSNQS